MSKREEIVMGSPLEGLISRKQLKQLLPISTMTIWRWQRDGKFPQHVTIGRTSFWRVTDIRAFLDTAR
jgi:predicted DNA-binding transcriptional regulator AlpA